MDALPDVCQYLGSDHVREEDVGVLKIHLETLWLLCTRAAGGEGTRLVKAMGTYPVIRELHLEVEDEGVRSGCERLVDVIMGDEGVGGSSHQGENTGAGTGMVPLSQDGKANERAGRMVTQLDDNDDDDEDDAIVPIF